MDKMIIYGKIESGGKLWQKMHIQELMLETTKI